MSSNTNTLFWVITGAVIVLGMFTLINFSKDNTIKNVFNKFDEIVEKNEIEKEYTFDEMSANKTNDFTYIDNNDIQLKVGQIDSTGLSWTVTNNRYMLRLINVLRLVVKDVRDDSYEYIVDYPMFRTFQPSERIVISSWIDKKIDNEYFYYTLEVE